MVRQKDDLLNALRERLGEQTDDASLAILEDVSDTIDDYETKTNDNTNWKEKYEENDAQWREKYRDRFFNTGSEDEQEDDDEPEATKPMRFEDLFSVKE